MTIAEFNKLKVGDRIHVKYGADKHRVYIVGEDTKYDKIVAGKRERYIDLGSTLYGIKMVDVISVKEYYQHLLASADERIATLQERRKDYIRAIEKETAKEMK